MDFEDFDEPAENWEPGAEVTKELFDKWRDARRGTTHAERLNNPVWDWLSRTRISAYQANGQFYGPNVFPDAPRWCCSRFGQSKTLMPDGRIFLIAGEHEDHYDPDFYIYNDVIVIHPNESIDIFGHTEDDFPPTDFHTATLVDDQIILIGNLSYPENREPDRIQVLSLNTNSLALKKIETTGQNPGWLFKHSASLSADKNSIIVREGERFAESILENIDDWQLDLHDWQWKRLTNRRWARIEFTRSDDSCNHLWRIRNLLWKKEYKWMEGFTDELSVVSEEIGIEPDLELTKDLYRPPIPHKVLPGREEKYSEFRIQINDVIVRFVENMHNVIMTVEGNLPDSTVEAIAADLESKLSRLENTKYRRVRRASD